MEQATIISGTRDGSEIALIEMAHQMSLSEDPMEAARGRFLKEVFPAFLRWMDGERPRCLGLDTLLVTSGFAHAIADMVGTWSGNLAKDSGLGALQVLDGARALMADARKEGFYQQIDKRRAGK